MRTGSGAMMPVSIGAAGLGEGRLRVLQLVAKDLSHERRARDAVDRARETLAALALAGTHMMQETDDAAIFGIIARELRKLGFESAVMLRNEPGGALRFAHLSYAQPALALGEKLLDQPLAQIDVHADRAPALNRALDEGRTVFTDRPVEVLQAVTPGAPKDGVAALVAALGIKAVIVAPLRSAGWTSGLLCVLGGSVRPGDVEAIDNFAVHASVSLERARLWRHLSEHSHRLEAEVERRTRELTLAVRALREVDRRKDNFLANISHELRTPLVTVLGYTQILLSEKLGPLSPQQRECLEVALASGRRLKAFIEELLDFSRYELTRDALSSEAFAVAGAVADVAKSFAPRLSDRKVRLRTRVHARTPQVWGDRRRIVQVLDNLVANAVRHCQTDGTGRVHVAAARASGGRVAVSIADNGEGIAGEHLPRIFDRLYQVGDTGTPGDGAGLGLGLNIVKSIVEAHGGSVRVRSAPGRGAKFTFLVPSVEVLRGGSRSPATEKPEPERPF